jgi:hypothetical protein
MAHEFISQPDSSSSALHAESPVDASAEGTWLENLLLMTGQGYSAATLTSCACPEGAACCRLPHRLSKNEPATTIR